MILWFIKPLRFLAAMIREVGSPRQIACGIALGMLVGLVPKANLTAIVLTTLMLSLRVNLAAGSLSAIAFSWVGYLVDPLADRIGFALLSHPGLEPYWTRLFSYPLVPWTALDNTVVLGSLVMGLALFYPVYHILSRVLGRLIGRYGERIMDLLSKYKLYQMLMGADLASTWRLRG